MRVGSRTAKVGRRVLAALTLCLITLTATVSAHAQSVTDFAGATYFEHVSLSPNGNLYSMVRFNRDGSSEARIYDRRTLQRVGGLTIPEGMSFTWVEWASDTTILASVSTQLRVEGRKIHLPTARIFSHDIRDRRKPVILFENEERILNTNIRLNRVVDMIPDDPDHIVMGAWRNGDFDLFRVNVETGEAERIAKGRDMTLSWFTDVTGRPSLRFDCATNTCRKINLYTPEDGADPSDTRTRWKLLRSFVQNNSEDDKFMDLQPLGPTANPDEFFVLDGRDEQLRRAVRVYNIRTNEFVETLFEDDRHDVSHALIDPKSRAYMGAQIWRDTIEYVLVDATLQDHLDTLNGYFEGDWNVSFSKIADNGSAALVYASASDEPGAYYIYDFKAKDTKRIARKNRSLHNALEAETEVLNIPVRDGTTLTGYLTVPGKNSKGRLIMIIHGGPEQRDVLDYDRDVQFLASRGYTVARVNFRGSSGYGRAFASAGYRQWGGVMHTDVIDATVWLQKRQDIAGSETCIMGYSYGAYAALLAGALQPQLYTCIVAGGGPSDLNQFLKDERKTHGRNSPQLAYWEKAIGERKADKDLLASISPINLVDRYDDPVLLVHATYDNTVEIDHSKDLEKALNKAGRSVELLELYGGHTHGTWPRSSRVAYLKKLEAFFATHLAPSASDPAKADAP